MTKCPHCQTTNIVYRTYLSESWVSTWRCDICQTRIWAGHNFYHCRSCCDRGGSSHEPCVKRCDGMYCTSCVNNKNNEWEREKQTLRDEAAKAKAELKAEHAEAAKAKAELKDEHDRQKEIADEKNQVAEDTRVKSNNFINKCAGPVAKLEAIGTDSKADEQDLPSNEELNRVETESTEHILQTKAAFATVKELANSTIQEISGMDTIATEPQKDELIDKIEQQQEIITKYKQNVRANITKTNEQEIKVVEQHQIVNAQIIKNKREQNDLHGIDEQIDTLRKELRGLSGKEINSNPAAVKKMKETYDKLLRLMQEKHAGNKQKIAELQDTKKRITDIRGKLMSTQSHNKYLLECLDKEYDRLNKAAEDVMIKFEQRAVYFLTVDCKLKEDEMQKFEDYGIHDDMDAVMELTDAELIDIGIEKPGVRNRILKKIEKLQQKN